MFIKKLALFGLAGLTALSMSCSDTDDEEEIVIPGGGSITGFDVTVGAPSSLAGTITAEGEGNVVKTVVIKADDATVPATNITGLVVGTATVNLSNVTVGGVCALIGNVTKTVKIEVIATFDEGEPASANKSKEFPCGGTGTPLTTWNFELGLASPLMSFYDLDSKTAYNTANALTNKDKVDIFAFTGSSNTTAVCGAGVCVSYSVPAGANIGQLTGEAYIFPLPPAAATILDGATTTTDIAPVLGMLDGVTGEYDEAVGFPNSVASVEATAGGWFLVNTTEEKWFAVKTTETGTNSAKFKAVGW